ncbi:MAG: hypothetical protein H0W42_03080 [Gemmatimonadaceae bacterium]|nr:hypothetical protein [Gemmatimonadaceae bacterium]
MRTGFLSVVAATMMVVGCSSQPLTGPTEAPASAASGPDAAFGESARTMNVANYVRINAITGVVPGASCVQAASGERFYVYDISAQNPASVAYEYDGAVFHSPTAGCAPTVENPSTRGGSATGQTVLQPGQAGNLIARFDTQAFSCGRVQIDHGFKPVGGPGLLQGDFTGVFYGLVIDYGVDCGAPPTVPPGPPAPIPTPTLPPTPPLPPQSGICELKAFSRIGRITMSDGIARISLQLAPGYDNIRVFFASYGSTTPFPSTGVTFPQELFFSTQAVLVAGPAQVVTVPIAGLPWAAWQVDLVCVPPPPFLVNRQTLPRPIIKAAFGNNPR